MDLLNISYTKESSVLTKGEMSFTLYENTNEYGQYSDYVLLFRDAHDLTSWPCAKRVRLWNQRTRVDSMVGTYNIFFFFFSFFLL